MKNIYLFLFSVLLISCESVNETNYKAIESSKTRRGSAGSLASAILDNGVHMEHSISLHRGYKAKKKSIWYKYDEPAGKKYCSGSYCY